MHGPSFFFNSSASVSVFYVWPKAMLLRPTWPADAERVDTPLNITGRRSQEQVGGRGGRGDGATRSSPCKSLGSCAPTRDDRKTPAWSSTVAGHPPKPGTSPSPAHSGSGSAGPTGWLLLRNHQSPKVSPWGRAVGVCVKPCGGERGGHDGDDRGWPGNRVTSLCCRPSPQSGDPT